MRALTFVLDTLRTVLGFVNISSILFLLAGWSGVVVDNVFHMTLALMNYVPERASLRRKIVMSIAFSFAAAILAAYLAALYITAMMTFYFPIGQNRR